LGLLHPPARRRQHRRHGRAPPLLPAPLLPHLPALLDRARALCRRPPPRAAPRPRAPLPAARRARRAVPRRHGPHALAAHLLLHHPPLLVARHRGPVLPRLPAPRARPRPPRRRARRPGRARPLARLARPRPRAPADDDRSLPRLARP